MKRQISLLGKHFPELFHAFGKGAGRRRGSFGNPGKILLRSEQSQKRLMIVLLQIAQSENRFVAESARRHGQHPQKALVVPRIHDQLQIRRRILDLFPLEELLSPDDLRADAAPPELLFKETRQIVGAVKNREVRIAHLRIARDHILDRIRDELRFRLAVAEPEDFDHLPLPFRRPEILLVAHVVFGDDRVGGIQDRVRRTVVLFKFDLFRAGEIIREVKNVGHHGAAPGINALVVVADHADVHVFSGEQAQDAELRKIGVLILIHQQIAVSLLIMLQSFGMLLENFERQQKHVVEVQRILKFQHLLVTLINLCKCGAVRVGVAVFGKCVGGPFDPVLHPADVRKGVRSADLIFGIAEFRRNLPDHAGLVGVVGNAEIRVVISGEMNVTVKHTRAERVERAQRHQFGKRRRDKRVETFPHFPCRLVGKRHAENRRGRDSLFDHIGDAAGDDTGLARPRAGKHQQRPLDRRSRLLLLRIQSIND